jgi:drug/metabolite transporter (DMT)-like permease
MTERKDRAAALTEISLILAAVFWGLNFAATKYAAESIPPLVIVAFRFTGGGLLLLLVLRLLEPESRPGRKDLILMAALGCFGVAIAQSGFTFGVSLTSAASTGLIFATAPVWGLLLGAVLGLERPTIRGIVGLALSVVGVAVVVFEGLGSGGDSLAGDLLVLMASVGVGGYTVLSMPLLERHTPLAVAGYPVVFGAPFLLVLSSGYLLDLKWGSVGGGTWAAVAFSVDLMHQIPGKLLVVWDGSGRFIEEGCSKISLAAGQRLGCNSNSCPSLRTRDLTTPTRGSGSISSAWS